jgi:hypothetical protein
VLGVSALSFLAQFLRRRDVNNAENASATKAATRQSDPRIHTKQHEIKFRGGDASKPRDLLAKYGTLQVYDAEGRAVESKNN